MMNPFKDHPYISAAVAYAIGKHAGKKSAKKQLQKDEAASVEKEIKQSCPDLSPEYIHNAVMQFNQAIQDYNKTYKS